MKELLRLTGGYKRHIDYLLTLQSEVMGVQNSLFKALGHDLVLSGCEITDHENGTVSIAPGVVYVSGQIVRFQGADNVPLDKAIVLNPVPVQTDPDEFFDGSVKPTYKELFATIGDPTNVAIQIMVNAQELYNIKQYMHDIVQSYGQRGETKWVLNLDGQFLNNFDGSGLGISTRWMGWALMNGNNGTPTMAGRTPIGVGSMVDTYGLQHNFTHNQASGQPRHRQTIPELAQHSHVMTSKVGVLDGNSIQGAGTSGSWANTGVGIHTNSQPGLVKSTQNAGSNAPFNIMQPYRAGYWVIKIA